MLKGGESESCACGLRATPNGMGEPTLFLRRLVAVPERTPGFGYRLRYGTGYEPALRCYPASSRERCVQCSLPCVSRSGKGKLSVRGPWPWAGGRYSLERLFAKEDKNRKSPLWKSPRLSEMGGSGIAVRLEWQSGSGCGDAPPDVSKGNRLRGDGRFASVENKPDLNRKIYRVHRHCALLGTLLRGAIG